MIARGIAKMLGFIFFFSPKFALGISVRYDQIVDTPYKGWTFAPLILLAF